MGNARILAEISYEALVRIIVEVMDPFLGAQMAERLFLDLRKRECVHRTHYRSGCCP